MKQEASQLLTIREKNLAVMTKDGVNLQRATKESENRSGTWPLSNVI